MVDSVERFPILRVTNEGKKDTEDIVTKELSLTIIFNNRELVTLLCSPVDLKYLAIGFLSSEGLLNSKDDVKEITVDDQKGVVRIETEGGKGSDIEISPKRLITSGGGRGTYPYSIGDVQNQAKMESQIQISSSEIFALVKEFQKRSQIFKTTGGVHSAALCDAKSILVFSEDIGRHNAIDKVFGECIWEDITTVDRIIITSGRISSEILLKIAKRNIPVLVSKAAPTNLGVRLANSFGVTLIGFVRGERMNIYSNGWRITA